MSERRCPFCGRQIPQEAILCPYCQEELPRVRPSLHFTAAASRAQIRRGLLYMLLAAVLYYFAAGYSPFQLPVAVAPMVTEWVVPLLFLGGLGLSLYGFYSRYIK